MKKENIEQLISGTSISRKKEKESWIISEVRYEPKFTSDSLKTDRAYLPSIKNTYTGSYTALKYLMLLNGNEKDTALKYFIFYNSFSFYSILKRTTSMFQ